MTISSTLSAVAASVALVLLVFVVARLLPLLWPHAVAAKISQIAKTRRHWHPRSAEDCPQCSAWIPPAPASLIEVLPWKATRSPRGRRHV